MNRVKEIREAKKWSAKKLADKAGIPKQTLSDIENKEMEVGVYRAQRVSKALGYSVAHVFPLPEEG